MGKSFLEKMQDRKWTEIEGEAVRAAGAYAKKVAVWTDCGGNSVGVSPYMTSDLLSKAFQRLSPLIAGQPSLPKLKEALLEGAGFLIVAAAIADSLEYDPPKEKL